MQFSIFFCFVSVATCFFQLWNQSYPLAPVSKVIASNYIVPSSLGVTPAAHLQVLFCWPRRVGQRGEGVEGRAKGEGEREQGRGGRAGREAGGRRAEGGRRRAGKEARSMHDESARSAHDEAAWNVHGVGF